MSPWERYVNTVIGLIRKYGQAKTPEQRLVTAKVERTLLDLALVADGMVSNRETENATACLSHDEAVETMRLVSTGIQPWSCWIGLNPDGLRRALHRRGLVDAAKNRMRKRRALMLFGGEQQ